MAAILAVKLIVWTLVLGLSSAQTNPPVSNVRYAQVLSQLSSITATRQRLASAATRYRNTLDSLKVQKRRTQDSCSCYNTPEVVFNAHLAADVPTFGIGQPLPFDDVTLNVGNGYDTRHSQFRAPVSGTYQFYITLYTNSGYLLSMDVLLNGNIITKVRTGNSNQVNTGTNGLILHLNKGDDLWIQHDTKITDSNRLYKAEGLLSTFSGYLVTKQ